ncbi:ABC transporter ATP-binding protein [Antarcticimicrobium sediminis]|uniref:ABC transporter ATP-binding protein n=1 Tax=Antarcticimicrobium sediminis TaxID=2546227 RepID=A0A4R5EIL0_9RHOB|nr:ABC transporter ATP-binding protein [Antarcticimicrobium sediminis]TDE34371.1 ABC transporter ATP-binding protein [Antarcticimicrobium sediminis]
MNTGHPKTPTDKPAAGSNVAVCASNVTMDFSGFKAVNNASFELEAGKFLTILGPSGSGKTTLLQMIAGFLTPTSGEITINGKSVDAAPPHRRSIGMVFQKLALFPHMTAAQNVAFPLKMRRFNPKTIPNRVAQFLDLVKLGDYGARRVNELSGGQQQRVAIARALVFEPELLLLDEPLAALDVKLREEMQLEFRRIQHELGVTTINVTHDQREALVVSDDIIVMDSGKIQQQARPVEMYRAPDNPFVAGFLGMSSFLRGTACAGGLVVEGQRVAGTASAAIADGAPVCGAIRAEQIRIAASEAQLGDCDTRLSGVVRDAIFEGERQLYVVALNTAGEAEIRVYHHDPLTFGLFEIGAPVVLGWNTSDMKIFADGGAE